MPLPDYLRGMRRSLYQVRPVGVVHSSFETEQEVTDSTVDENKGEIEILAEYEGGLTDLEGFSHIVVVCWMHRASFRSLKVRPIRHPESLRGVFATRHPGRPNPIGVTVVRLLERRGRVLKVKGLDMVDGTPVLDVKPYTRTDQKADAEFGWTSPEIPGRSR